ncbi:MAG TPA: BON domain-containing protein [Gaiellaceae bacterium]|nr:BON domain-containing protein [Gaiellaceae bacterium]
MRKLVSYVALGWLAAWFADPQQGRRRRAMSRDRGLASLRRLGRRSRRAGRGAAAHAYGLKQHALHLHEQPKGPVDDVTLARKVETEIFRPADVPKGKINVNAENGKVVLRGEADTPELIDELVRKARRIQGVREVESLLHLPGASARPHA